MSADEAAGDAVPVLGTIDEGVAIITLNRPTKLNALNAEILEELFSAVVEAEEEDDVGCLVITGSPEAKKPAFAAGADIAEMAEMGGLQLREYSILGHQAFGAIETCSKPVIAAINGFAFGGGLELAMACHIRYAAQGASMGQPEINLGIIPGFGGTQRLARLVGKGRALEMLLTGDPIDAPRAKEIGLVNEVVAADALMDACMALARKISAKAPVARGLILDAVNRGGQTDPETALTLESDLFGLVGTTEDVREGMRAFLEKRQPEWKGR